MIALIFLAAIVAGTYADKYFTGDGTAYTLGQTSAGNCNMMSALDFATTEYAALNNEQWDGLQNCGRCAQVSCDDDRCDDTSKTIVVQILDRCPECKYGDLDLSPSVFTALTGSMPSRYTIKWKFVDCPVSGNVNYCLKGGSNNYWMGVQPTNCATGVKSMQINGHDTTMLGSAYYYLLDGASQTQTDLTSLTISITDVNGYSIEDTVSLTANMCTEGTNQFPTNAAISPKVPLNPSTILKPVFTVSPMTKAPQITKLGTLAPIETVAPTQVPTQIPAPPTQSTSPATVHPDAPLKSLAPGPQQESIRTTIASSSNMDTPTVTPVTVTPSLSFTQDLNSFADDMGTVQPETSTSKRSAAYSENMDTSSVESNKVYTFEQEQTHQLSKAANAATNTHLIERTQPIAYVHDTATHALSAEQVEEDNLDTSDGVQVVSTKSEMSQGGTDPVIIVLSSLGGVGVVALIAVVVMVKRKNIRDEKARDMEGPSMISVRSFDVGLTPSDRRQPLATML